MSTSERTTVAFAAVALLYAGCSTPTTSTQVWKSPSYAGGPKTSLVVFGGRMNETNRHVVEDAFVKALSAQGVRATASYNVFAGPLPDLDIARQTVQANGYDGVLVSTMHRVTERLTVEPGVAYTGPFWGSYYGPAWGYTGAPTYVETDKVVRFETTLWDPQGGGKMIWSDLTDTQNPSSTSDFAKSLTNHVVPAMAKEGLLPPGAPVSLAPQPGAALPMQAAGR